MGFFMVRCVGGGLDRLLDWGLGEYGDWCLFVLFVWPERVSLPSIVTDYLVNSQSEIFEA